MKGFIKIDDLAPENHDLRRVLYTGKHLQLVLMALNPGEQTGDYVHVEADQFFRVENGKGELILEGDRIKIKSKDAIIVPAGAHHNVINTGAKPMRLFMVYAPPHDRDILAQAAEARGGAAPDGREGGRAE
jgi:mannose-6-phosphate isomerase-like protein (cupin superfamily)